MLFIIVWIPLLILGDYNCGMDQILFPSRMGQTRLMRAKMCIGCLISITITIVMTAIQWAFFTMRWDFGQLDIPIQSLSGFETSHVQCSIAQCIFIGGILRVFAVIALVFLLCILSAWIRKEAITITIAASIIICSAIGFSKYANLSALSIYATLSGAAAFKHLDANGEIILLVSLFLKVLLYGVTAKKLLARKRQ